MFEHEIHLANGYSQETGLHRYIDRMGKSPNSLALASVCRHMSHEHYFNLSTHLVTFVIEMEGYYSS